jgi:hypothetical protein
MCLPKWLETFGRLRQRNYLIDQPWQGSQIDRNVRSEQCVGLDFGDNIEYCKSNIPIRVHS